jgi:enoyl-CoA hydratase/carnithine racemase
MTRPYETIRYDVADGVATITLDRPEKLNAFTSAMMLDLIAAFDATDADDAVRAVIVTGAGRAFCAGADLGSAGGATFDYAKRGDEVRNEARVGDVYRDGGGRVSLRIFDSLKPVIAAINGPAVGIGATMLLPMDIRIASTGARSVFRPRSSGAIPAASSMRPKRKSAVSCARFTNRTRYSQRRVRSPRNSRNTRRRSRSR